MQFQFNETSRTNDIQLDFTKLNFKAQDSLTISFLRIGGVSQSYEYMEFPLFINQSIIEQIIHNTCFVCGGLMTSLERKIEPVMRIRICQSCGHSHT